ncbi:MAG: fructosamine kinase family protein [Verrucomicrobiota bacterium]
MLETLRDSLETALGRSLGKFVTRPVGGGCINESFVLEEVATGDRFFVKKNRVSKAAMLEAEADGLAELASVGAIRIPQRICLGESRDHAFLVLEYLDLQRRGDEERMGRELAQLHRVTSGNGNHGWQRDNFIGETPQSNTWTKSWSEFFAQERIERQLVLAKARGPDIAGGEALVERIPDLLESHAPVPSLLHGDLWGGNAGFDGEGAPVLFDPAVYYGDRETDLAFTEMFGGFSAGFYGAYREAFPLEDGYERRRTLYNVYHILNHFVLFGGGYRRQAERMIDELLAL